MNRIPPLAILLLATLVAGCTAQPAALVQVSPEEAGLAWRECQVTDLDMMQAQSCFGAPRPALADAERARLAARTAVGQRLTMGVDVYETRHLGLGIIPGWPWDPYVLLQSGRPLAVLFGEVETHDPDLSLREIAGQVAWEFADPHQATVIYGGRDLRRVYRLEAAYRPYELAGRLAFIGKKAGRYVLVYGGRQVGPAFDGVIVAYCCEPAAYAPSGAAGSYRFWGTRDGRQYVVEVAAHSAEFGIYLGSEPVGAPFLSTADIVSYDGATHEIALTPDAVARIRALKVPTSGTPFVVCLGREPVYRGAFWTGLSSQSYDGVIIETLAAERGTVCIELGYPGPGFFRGPDPRPDPRLMQALQQAGKLR